jgi:hypothetical protein
MKRLVTNTLAVNIPQYVPRKSQNELRALAAGDPSLKGKDFPLPILPSSNYYSSTHTMTTAKIMKRAKKTLHIQKLPRSTTALNKGSPVSLSSSSDSSDTDSSYDSDSDTSPPPEKSPLPATRSLKAVEAVRYDTIKAVWFPRNKFAENERILKGLADLWEVIRTIRDRWKTDRDAVKKAVEAKQESELPLLRERVDKQIEMMEAVLKAAAEFGHPDLLSAYVLPPALPSNRCVMHFTFQLVCTHIELKALTCVVMLQTLILVMSYVMFSLPAALRDYSSFLANCSNNGCRPAAPRTRSHLSDTKYQITTQPQNFVLHCTIHHTVIKLGLKYAFRVPRANS